MLEDETNQTIVLIDRLLRDVSEDVQRQTAYAGNERANLTTLASAIKNGELYGAELGGPMIGEQCEPGAVAYGGTPLVVIRFDRPNVDYQQILYAALNQALQSRPQAAFSVVAVSPTRGTVAAVQLAQTAAKRHAQEVMRSITDMGVPASRLAVASSTDPQRHLQRSARVRAVEHALLIIPRLRSRTEGRCAREGDPGARSLCSSGQRDATVRTIVIRPRICHLGFAPCIRRVMTTNASTGDRNLQLQPTPFALNQASIRDQPSFASFSL